MIKSKTNSQQRSLKDGGPIFLLLVFSLIISGLAAQNCLPGGITFSSQTAINNFASTYPGCSTILGDVTISGINIANLNGLYPITSIEGSVLIQNNQNLTSLGGLENLISVGGEFYIKNNGALTSLRGLDGLSSINYGFYVYNNASLSSLDGVEGLQSMGGTLDIENNDVLTSLDALANLTSVGQGMILIDNPILSSLSGLDNIIFENISPWIELVIINCPNVAFCGVESICRYLDAGGEFILEGNADGCNTTSQISASCGICTADTITINDNPVPDNTIIAVYDWIKSAGRIAAGSSVSMQAQNYILLQPGFYAERNSKVDLRIAECSSNERILPASPAPAAMAAPSSKLLQLYPNPASESLTIAYELLSPQRVSLWIQAVNGKRQGRDLLHNVSREAGNWQLVLDTTSLPTGVYVVFLETDEQRLAQKLMIVRN